MSEVRLENRLEARKRPSLTPVMYQEWRDLLFLHWEFDPKVIQNTLPPGLFVDTFQDKAYVSIIPFFMKNVSFGNMPALPGFANFMEVNLRTYVYDRNGIPGIWFYSLDLNSQMGTSAARQFFYLPYYYATFNGGLKGEEFIFSGKREDDPSVAVEFIYKPTEPHFFAQPDSLDFFLTERYVMFTYQANQLYLGRVHHAPYPLSQVEVVKYNESLFNINHLPNPNRSPNVVQYSNGVDVDIFKLDKDIAFEHQPK